MGCRLMTEQRKRLYNLNAKRMKQDAILLSKYFTGFLQPISLLNLTNRLELSLNKIFTKK